MEIEKQIVAVERVPSPRNKTQLRNFYENQVQLIKDQFGDIDKIRQDLGLSQRQMAQLLMVDPSTWTRWSKQKSGIPPHIYRALQWLMIIKDQVPNHSAIPVRSAQVKLAQQLDAQFFEKQKESEKKRDDTIDQLQLNLLELQNKMSGQNQTIKILFFSVLLLVGILVGRLIKSILLPSV